MSRDKAEGLALLIISIVVIVVYNVFMWGPFPRSVPMFLLQLTDSIIVVVVLAILAWIGYTLATTPPPKPIEEIEKELEKELKALTAQKGGQESSGGEGSASSGKPS